MIAGQISTLELRPHQVRGIEGLREGFRAGHRVQMLCGPCAFGKTELAIHMLSESAKNGKRSGMLLDRIVLCNQTSARLDKYGVEHGIMQAGHWRNKGYERIQVISAQTLEKMGTFPELDLLIVDEAHSKRADTIEFIKNNPRVKVVGLSATPFTKGLGETYTNVVCSATTEELVGKGYLAPLRIFIAKEIGMDGAKTTGGEWQQKEAGERGILITGDVVSEWVKKTHELFGAPKKTVVFAASVAHAQSLAEGFAEAGHNFISLSYKDDDEYKREVIADFSKPDTKIQGLIAVDILTKGFDVSDVMIGVMARPWKKSFSSYVQQLGRVMRPFPGKEFGVILDHAGNCLRFQDDWERVYSEGVTSLDNDAEKPKKEPTLKEKEAAKCGNCGAMWSGNATACPHCGHERPTRNEVVAVAGEMQEYKRKKTSAEEQNFYSQLLSYAAGKNYKPIWARFKFEEKFGHIPKGLKTDFCDVTPAVFGWIKSRNIAYAKSRELSTHV